MKISERQLLQLMEIAREVHDNNHYEPHYREAVHKLMEGIIIQQSDIPREIEND